MKLFKFEFPDTTPPKPSNLSNPQGEEVDFRQIRRFRQDTPPEQKITIDRYLLSLRTWVPAGPNDLPPRVPFTFEDDPDAHRQAWAAWWAAIKRRNAAHRGSMRYV